jgi:hypothetical protein
MLVEYKVKEFDKLIITDFNADIIRIAKDVVKRNIFVEGNPPENYIITISLRDKGKVRYNLNFLNNTDNTSPLYCFDFNVNIIDDNKEIFGNIRIDSNGMLKEYNASLEENEGESKIDPIIMDLITKKKDEYCLDINSKNPVSVNDGLLKFYDNEAKISVIQDLKNKFNNKEST